MKKNHFLRNKIVLDKFDALLSDVIDWIMGICSTSTGYQYSEIIRTCRL